MRGRPDIALVGPRLAERGRPVSASLLQTACLAGMHRSRPTHRISMVGTRPKYGMCVQPHRRAAGPATKAPRYGPSIAPTAIDDPARSGGWYSPESSTWLYRSRGTARMPRHPPRSACLAATGVPRLRTIVRIPSIPAHAKQAMGNAHGSVVPNPIAMAPPPRANQCHQWTGFPCRPSDSRSTELRARCSAKATCLITGKWNVDQISTPRNVGQYASLRVDARTNPWATRARQKLS